MNPEPGPLHIGETFQGRYRIVSEGTADQSGISYKAYDLPQDRLVVIKVLDAAFGTGPELLDRLGTVKKALDNLAQPALLRIDELGLIPASGQAYLVRRHVKGRTLADLLLQVDYLYSDAAVDIAIQVCEILAYAHRAGLVHGGLSPQSVLLADEGVIFLTGTGLLPALHPVLRPTAQRPDGLGDYFAYISPEQAAGEAVHPASDVYVVGLLLYTMLTGRPPFEAENTTELALQHLRRDPTQLQMVVPHVAPALAQVVHKALAKEPAARYRHAGQMAHILRSQLAAPLPPAKSQPAAVPQAAYEERFVTSIPPSMPAGKDYPGREGPAEWYEQPAGIDWLMVALVIAALIAVLGLIPLWQTVYRRYAVPPPIDMPSRQVLPAQPAAFAPLLSGEWPIRAGGRVAVRAFGIVHKRGPAPAHCDDSRSPERWPAVLPWADREGLSTELRRARMPRSGA